MLLHAFMNRLERWGLASKKPANQIIEGTEKKKVPDMSGDKLRVTSKPLPKDFVPCSTQGGSTDRRVSTEEKEKQKRQSLCLDQLLEATDSIYHEREEASKTTGNSQMSPCSSHQGGRRIQRMGNRSD